MSYEDKLLFSREWYLKIAAEEAKALFCSDNATTEEKESFLNLNQWYSEAGVEGKWSDDLKDRDLMALVVLDDVPHEVIPSDNSSYTKRLAYSAASEYAGADKSQMINEALRLSTKEEGASYLWLADTYDTLSNYDPDNPGAEGTLDLLDSNWRSPFVGSSVEEVAAFIRAAPKPPKPLCKTFFAVLEKKQFEQSKELSVYKILDVEGATDGEIKLQSVPCPAYLVGYFFTSFERYGSWDQAVEAQGLFFGTGPHWKDDCGYDIDLFSLILLDDFPIETINHVLQNNEAVDMGIWLADAYENLPDVRPTHRLKGTSWPIAGDWRSPFAGKSIEDAANFVRNAPKPPKPLNKVWFAVMQKEHFEKNGTLLVCKILPVGGEVELSENGQIGTKSYRKTDMTLMCKIRSDKQLEVGELEGEDEGEFEIQMQSMEVGELGNWVGSDDAKYWWLG